jgi:hypothetical protein
MEGLVLAFLGFTCFANNQGRENRIEICLLLKLKSLPRFCPGAEPMNNFFSKFTHSFCKLDYETV